MKPITAKALNASQIGHYERLEDLPTVERIRRRTKGRLIRKARKK